MSDQSIDGFTQQLAEELELSPVQPTYDEWFAEERRARLARMQRRLRLRNWVRRHREALSWAAFLAVWVAAEIFVMTFAMHVAGLSLERAFGR